MSLLILKIKSKLSPYFFHSFLILFISSCTGNPLSDNNIQGQNTQISGNVELRDNINPEGTFVWFEGFNSSTRVNKSGDYKLFVPPNQSQGGTNGISGVFKIYFYLANYKLTNAEVAIRNGKFVYSSGDVNEDGKLPQIYMYRHLSIDTKISPPSVLSNYTGTIDVDLTLQGNAPMFVEIPFTIPGQLGAILVRNVETNEIFTFRAYPHMSTSEIVEIGSGVVRRTLGFDLLTFTLPQGKYEVIPYLIIKRNDVPSALLIKLGNVRSFGPSYLNMPIKRTGGNFEITQ